MNLRGDDISYLLSENGEMLDAFEVLLFQIYGREFDRSQRFTCDADGFRQSRKAELQAMARFAAQNVRKNGRPFTFGVLNSTERRVIHLTLQVEEDLITESVGDGRDRRLQVRLK
jgi:spoIIIJ-associated protein